jgi:hypothetical protein
LSFKGKTLTHKSRAMMPGVLYVKMRMSPEIAQLIEDMPTVYTISRSRDGFVIPLSDEEGNTLEGIALRKSDIVESIEDHKDFDLIKKDEYVSIINGVHMGKYGIVHGTRRGKLEVILRGDYKDDWDLFELNEVKYLANPPEKKWNELSAKEALESLLQKDPSNPTIKLLRSEGLLEHILDDDSENNEDNCDDDNSDDDVEKSLGKPSKRSSSQLLDVNDFNDFSKYLDAIVNDRNEE